ncbi:MAG TPA: response regulator transcription factor [Beijerinckiaceae bacterium]|nr:response regulator transcription factor [Beijerinckiaceae bacterium]
MLKDAAADTLLECLDKVAGGDRWLPTDVVDAAVERVSGRKLEVDRLEALTVWERELALWVAEGLSNKHTARRASVSEGTVKIHLHNMFQKLGVANRTSLAALALAHRDRLVAPKQQLGE